MRTALLTSLILLSLSRAQNAVASDLPVAEFGPLGALHALVREVSVSAVDCGRTWRMVFNRQAECKVALWPEDPQEVILEPLPLIGLWNYVDEDFKATVTFTRELTGYAIRLDINNEKYAHRMDYQTARKYIERAIQVKKFEKFQTLVARNSRALRQGHGFTEAYKGPLKVFERQVKFSRGQPFFERCRQLWTGFRCTLNLIRNLRGESVLNDAPVREIKSGRLTLTIKPYRGWQDGTGFSLLTVILRTDLFDQLNNLAADYDAIARQLPQYAFVASQVEGDNLPEAPYAQRMLGNLNGVYAQVWPEKPVCQSSYGYATGKFKASCEGKVAMPGLLAQAPLLFMQFLTFKNVGSYVQVFLTPAGWRMDFTGDEKSVGLFTSVEPHFDEAMKLLRASGAGRVFLTY